MKNHHFLTSFKVSALFLFAFALSLNFLNAQTYNPLTDFKANANPTDVWSFGSGTVGGDFTSSTGITKRETASIKTTNEGWKGVYLNPANGNNITLSTGLVLKPGMVMMHPGNKGDHLSKIRFTAPKDGLYNVSVKWTSIDVQAKKSETWVVTNAITEKGLTYDFTPKGYKSIFTERISGHNDSSSYKKEISMKKGEVILFEVGNGGDQYSDDALSIDLNISFSTNTLNAGEELKAGERLMSANGAYILKMQNEDGNLCVYNFANNKQGAFVWGSMTNGITKGKLFMQTDGNLVVYNESNEPQWASNTHPFNNPKFKTPTNKPVKLVLENDGKLNLYNASNAVVWSSK